MILIKKTYPYVQSQQYLNMASPAPTGLLDPNGQLGDHNRKYFYSKTTEAKIKNILKFWNDPYPPPNEEIQVNLRGHHTATKAHLFDQVTDIIASLQQRGAPIGNDDLVDAFITGKPSLFFAQWWNRAQRIALPRLQAEHKKLQDDHKKLQMSRTKSGSSKSKSSMDEDQLAHDIQDQLLQDFQQQVTEQEQRIKDLEQKLKEASTITQEEKELVAEIPQSRKRRATRSDLQTEPSSSDQIRPIQDLGNRLVKRDRQITGPKQPSGAPSCSHKIPIPQAGGADAAGESKDHHALRSRKPKSLLTNLSPPPTQPPADWEDQLANRDQQIQELQRRLQVSERATVISTTTSLVGTVIDVTTAQGADVVVSAARAPVLVPGSLDEQGRSEYRFEGGASGPRVGVRVEHQIKL